MLLTVGMKNACNDDEELSFQTLAAATANVLLKIEQKDHPPEQKEDRKGKEAEEAKRNFVAQRIREIGAFEKRARGK